MSDVVRAPIVAARRVFGVVSDTRRRRRPSDGVRLFFVVVGLLLIVALLDGGAGPEARVADARLPLPSPYAGTAELLFWAAPVLASLVCLVAAVASRRWAIVRDVALAVLAASGVVLLLRALFGADGGRPSDPTPAAGSDFPTLALCVAVGAVAVAGPYLTRPTRRLVVLLVVVGAVAALFSEQAMPAAVVASVLVGVGAAAITHLLVGSPTGFPSRAEVAEGAASLGVPVVEVQRAEHQRLGVARFVARTVADDRAVDITVYGRDAADAQLLTKAWRFLWYRDTGPSFTFTRLQQVEHEAVTTLLAARAGATVPEVLAVGTSPSEDALLITAPPPGSPLAAAETADVTDAALDDSWTQLRTLHGERLSHGAVDAEHVLVTEQAAALVGFEDASTSAPPERIDQDTAQLLVALALEVDEERAVDSAVRMLGTERLGEVLAQVQAPALERETRRTLPDRRKFLSGLRDRAATAAGIEPPALAEVRRVSLTDLLLVGGTLLGFWLLISELTGMGDVWGTIATADWWLVAVALVFAQATQVAQSYALVGAVQGGLPFGPVVALQFGLAFTGLVGGTVANTATMVRFFQMRGLAASVAVSSGVLVSLVAFLVQAILFATCFWATAGDFSFDRTGTDSSSSDTAQLVLVAIVVVGVLASVLFFVPRVRSRIVGVVKPQLSAAADNLKAIAKDPRKLGHLFFGNLFSQVLFATALSLCLHAYGESASLPALIVINTMASLFGGLAPVPGGMGVVEASLIAGLTAYGIPSTEAAAAVLTYRMLTSYLPPAWGYPSLMWLRRRAYL